MKIAILMTAYRNEAQLNNLIQHLCKDFDIYVHIDKRSAINVRRSERIHIYREYKSYWASFNMVKTILLLIQEASKNNYDRYVLLTGQDLPLKKNKYIIEFFERHRNIEFLDYFKLPSEKWNNGGIERVSKYWGRSYLKLSGFERYLAYAIKIMLITIYKTPLAFLFYRKVQYQLYGGSAALDITDHCVKEILNYLEEHQEYLNRFKYTHAPDEIFFLTIILNLKLETIVENKSLRFIEWEGGASPKTFTIDDYQRVMSSECLFARKFDENVDNEIIKKIYKEVT